MELKQKASTTGLRILSVLDILLKGPASKNEIINALAKNSHIKNLKKETIGLDINTLKAAGFEIENMGKADDYRYKINWCPIKFKLTQHELRVLINLKNAVIELSEPYYIIKLYKLFEKITKFIEDDEVVNELMNFQYFLNIDFALLNELYVLSKRKKEVKLLYNSPNSGQKEIKIKLREIKYTNSKLYLTGASSNYPDITVLRVDNIVKILKILKTDEKTIKPKVRNAVYKIKPEAKQKMNFLDEEKIIAQNDNFIKIELKSDNDFMITQRLLNFGCDLISIKDNDIKEQYLAKLRAIKEIYKEDSIK